jgi:hypothetical protein
MRQAMRIPSRVGCVVRGLGGTARTIGEGDPIPFPYACFGLALLGLLVGVCLIVLPSAVSSRRPPDLPRTVVDAAMRLLRVPTPHVACPAMGAVPQASRPRDGLVWEDSNLDDDDPWGRVALTAEGLVLPSTPFRRSTGLTDAYPWPSRYLARPQLLTRL